MSISSELEELTALHEEGRLSDSEFWVAKRRLLSNVGESRLGTRVEEVARPTQRRERFDSPHPMRVVLSVFALLVALSGLVLAAVVPFSFSLYDGVISGRCKAPLLEVFDDGYSRPGLPTGSQPSSSTIVPSSGKYAELFAEAGRNVPNYCRDEAITRTVFGAMLLFCGLGALLFLWRQDVALRTRRTRR